MDAIIDRMSTYTYARQRLYRRKSTISTREYNAEMSAIAKAEYHAEEMLRLCRPDDYRKITSAAYEKGKENEERTWNELQRQRLVNAA
jgi:hypothetical protein